MTDRPPFAVTLAAVAVLIMGASIRPSLAADEYRVGDCVGPVVTGVDPGDPRTGVPTRYMGVTPAIMAGPGPSARPTGQKLPPGGSYTVVGVSGRDLQLGATRFAPPFPAGTVVGWFKPDGFHHLALRNCP